MNKIFEFCARHSAKLTVGLLVLMVAFPFVFTSSYVLRIAITVLMYIVLSLSLNLLIGYLGQMSRPSSRGTMPTPNPLATIPVIITSSCTSYAMRGVILAFRNSSSTSGRLAQLFFQVTRFSWAISFRLTVLRSASG